MRLVTFYNWTSDQSSERTHPYQTKDNEKDNANDKDKNKTDQIIFKTHSKSNPKPRKICYETPASWICIMDMHYGYKHHGYMHHVYKYHGYKHHDS